MTRSFLRAVLAFLAATTVTAQGTWKVVGNSGVTAMHMILVAPQRLLIIDKAENNPQALLPNGGGKTGWSAEYNLDTNKFRVLPLTTNTFCSAGAFLGNGTFLSTAGVEVVNFANVQAIEGYAGIRMYNPCLDDSCLWTEIQTPLSSKRWYDAMTVLPDGSAVILGGSTAPTAVNDGAKNNPTYEIFGANGLSKPFNIQFLSDTLPYNLYPFIHVISNGPYQGYAFIFASIKSVVYDLPGNKVIKALPDLPGGVIRSYPLTGTCSFLPLTYQNNYKPSILICGGQSKNDPLSPAENSCGRIDLSVVEPSWEMDDFGGLPRVMSDVVIQADGKVVFVNGAGIGISGYIKGTTPLADKPVFTPVLYDMTQPKGSRWSKYAATNIPRMYHSVATLITDGSIIVAGSNPNEDFKATGPYPTEYRVENFAPPYLNNGSPRPTVVAINGTTFNKTPTKVAYNQPEQIKFTLPAGQKPGTITAALIYPGFKTHSQSMGERYVQLQVTGVNSQDDGFVATVWTPPNNFIMPPGPRYLFILNNGTPGNTAIHVQLN